MAQAQFEMESKIGRLYLVASEKGLKGVFWKRQDAPMAVQLKGDSQETKNLKAAVRELSEYLNGKRTKFDIALDIEGTDFQKKVWKELRKIPYGKTASYKEIANKIKTEGIRAVGTANGRNPLCIVIPCHRVIASDGGLGGYSGGVSLKKRLLLLEQEGTAL